LVQSFHNYFAASAHDTTTITTTIIIIISIIKFISSYVAGSVVVSALRYHAKSPGFAPRPGRSIGMSRLGIIHLVEGKAAREWTGHRPHAVAENRAVANVARPPLVA